MNALQAHARMQAEHIVVVVERGCRCRFIHNCSQGAINHTLK